MGRQFYETLALAVFFMFVIWYVLTAEVKQSMLEREIEKLKAKKKKCCRNCEKLRIEVHNREDRVTTRFSCCDDYHEVKLTDTCKNHEDKIR